MSWQPVTVVAIYKAIIQRETVEQIEVQRLHITSALFSNPVWDEPGNDRKRYLEELNRGFNQAIELVYYPQGRPGPKIDWSKPWFAAAKRGMEKTREKYAWAIEAKSMRDIVKLSPEQIQARERSLKEIDQR